MNDLPGFETVERSKPLDSTASCKDRLPESEPAPRLKTINRRQLLLRPVDVERLVPLDHEVRAIWEFTGGLDLTPYYQDIKAVEGRAGSTAFDPRLLLAIWIYAYSKGIGSAREISRLCDYDPAYQWLSGMEPIGYHTLSDFRSTHSEALDELFAEVLGILSHEGLVTLEQVMHDGVKIKACAGSDSFRREEKLKAHLDAAREQVERLKESPEEDLRLQRARERAAREQKERLEHALAELATIREAKSSAKDKENARASMTDPEARIMKGPGGGYAPAYNAQISTDAANTIIVAAGVSQRPDDFGELVPAIERIQETTGSEPSQVVADGGFTSRENIIALDEKGIDFIGSLQEGNASFQFEKRGVDPAFYPEHFVYDPDTDTCRCPQQKVLTYRRKDKSRSGKTTFMYQARAQDCQGCPSREKCCPGRPRRYITRGVDDPVVIVFIKKMETEEAKACYKKRGPIAEFPNAWIKDKLGLRQFHLRGLVKAGMEIIWACLTYNIQQWIRLVWRPRLA